MFQPRNRRIEVVPMACTAKPTKFAWFSNDGDPETGKVWAWGCEEIPLTILTHQIGLSTGVRYIICSDRGMFWKARGTWERKGHVKHFATPSEAAAFAETL